MNRISMIVLGVNDIDKSFKFYHDGLGFVIKEKISSNKLVFFDTTGTKFELCPRELLSLDINRNNPPKITDGFAGTAFAYNVRSKWELDQTIELARNAGALIVKEPEKICTGGYSSWFKDPDGYYWEVAHNPNWSFDGNNMLVF
jgi:predicted lactoylglutathione lyase